MRFETLPHGNCADVRKCGDIGGRDASKNVIDAAVYRQDVRASESFVIAPGS